MPEYSVLHILDHSLPVISGYSIRSRGILAAQKARGWSVEAVTGARHRAEGPATDWHGEVAIHRLPKRTACARPRGVLGIPRDVLALAHHIESVARRCRPDILHAHSPAINGLAAAIAAQRLGLPLVYEVRAFWEDAAVANGQTGFGSLRYRLTRWLENRVFARADAVAVICAGLGEDIAARGIPAEKLFIVPNAVAMDDIVPPARDPMLAARFGIADADVLAFVGSFYAYEGLADLIAAMPDIVAQHPRAALMLVGDGPEAAALETAARASPVAHHICWVGAAPQSEVAAYYGLASLMVYPRKSMRLTELVTPLKPLEAIAMGKPVAVSNVGGHRDLLGPTPGAVFFPPDNPAALASTVLDALRDQAALQQAAEKGAMHVRAHHDWAGVVDHYDPVYHRLVKQQAARRMR